MTEFEDRKDNNHEVHDDNYLILIGRQLGSRLCQIVVFASSNNISLDKKYYN